MESIASGHTRCVVYDRNNNIQTKKNSAKRNFDVKAHRGQATIGHDVAQTVINTHHTHVLGHVLSARLEPTDAAICHGIVGSINGRTGRIVRQSLTGSISTLRCPVAAHELRWLDAMRTQCLAPAFLAPHARKRALGTRDKVHGLVPLPQQVLDHLARAIELVVIDR